MMLPAVEFEGSSFNESITKPDSSPHIWSVRVADHRATFARVAHDVLDEQELRRADGFRRSVDRDRYLVTHVALRLLLAAYLGISPREVQLTRAACPGCAGPHGRPAVVGAGLHFSVSHSGEYGLLAFATVPVGVDVEKLPEPARVDAACERMHPREVAELAVLPVQARCAAFARAWVRKEAYLKGLGIGLARGLARDYVGVNGASNRVLDGWSISDVDVDQSHFAAVALSNSRPLKVNGVMAQ